MHSRKISEAGKSLIKSFESCRRTAYLDGGGVWTIGWGHTHGVKEFDTCSQSQADAWLAEDMADAEKDVELYATGVLSQEQFDALCCLAYNIGGKQFRTSTLVRQLNSKNLPAVAKEWLKWKFDNGKEVAGLLRRREAELKLFKGAAP